MSPMTQTEDLRQQGLALMRANRAEEALPLFDRALAVAESEEERELLTINKAGAHLALGISSSEIQALPSIIMRRRNPLHLYLAAYNLGAKFQNEKDYKRAAFYANIALEAAESMGDLSRKGQTLLDLGNLAVYDSRVEDAIALYEQALELFEERPENAIRRAFVFQNIGYCRLTLGQTDDGISLVKRAIDAMKACGAEGFAAESYIDLCLGYLDKGELETARYWGELGLEQATETRQVRNAHYLLGEVAYNSGDITTAEFHFENLARYYPEFANLKNLLYAIDLRKMVNFKL